MALTHFQELELLNIGTPEAKSQLIRHNLGLVHSVARRFHNPNSCFTYDDLIQEGSIGLCKALEKFDSSRGLRLSTVAYTYIRNQIMKALTEKSRTIRIPNYLVAQKATEKLPQVTASLDFKIGDGEKEVIDFCGYMDDCSQQLEYLDTKAEIAKYIDKLTDKQQQVIVLVYWSNKSFAEVGRILNTSRVAVKKNHDKAIISLRKLMAN